MLSNKLLRRQVAERAVREALIIVEPQGFNDVLGLGAMIGLGFGLGAAFAPTGSTSASASSSAVSHGGHR